MRDAFALQKLLTFFQQKIMAFFRFLHLNETLTKDVVSFEQPGPVLYGWGYSGLQTHFLVIVSFLRII